MKEIIIENIFQEGDIVYWKELKGKVIISKSNLVKVTFEETPTTSAITLDFFKGGEYIMWGNKCLSFTPYTSELTSDGLLLKGFTQERPWTPKKGELVLVSNNKEKWFLKEYLCSKGNSDWLRHRHEVKQFYTEDEPENENTANYNYCKPFKP